MEKERKYPASPADGRLNADDADFAVGINEWVNMENLRHLTTDDGVTSTIESIGSTILKSTPQPSATYLEIGKAEDEANGWICYFKKNSTGPWDKITCYIASLDQEYDVLLSSQVNGGLNFDSNYLIHSARIIDGLLYWTDNLNPQRRINVMAGIKLNNPSFDTDVAAYTSPLEPEVITILRPPPQNPLNITKVEQTSPAVTNNYIENGTFQFSLRYVYRDGEISVPSVYSLIAPYNIKSDTYNRIDVVVSQNEIIPQDAQRVDVLVKYDGGNSFFRVKSWDRNVPAEETEIEDHNNGITPLTYNFYNDTVGEAQDEAYSLKPFDSVPIQSETLELFKNRLGLGDNIEGYDTPITSSLNLTLYDQTQGETVVARWVIIEYGSGAHHYFVDLGELGFFDSTVQPPPFPASVDYVTDLTFVAAGPASFALYIVSHYTPPWTNGIEYTGDTSTVTNAPDPVSLIGARCFKTGGLYKAAVTFYDFGDRKCGITGAAYISGVAVAQPSIQIPERSYDTVTYVTFINWALSNADATNEIPIWATHYSVDITKCLTTRFFLVARSKNSVSSMTYVNRDADNAYTFTTSAFDSELTGVGVDITNLQNFGMGYQFQLGDIIKIYISGDSNLYRLSIIDQDGRWLICELQDLGTLDATTDALFEIYTPYQQQFNEPFYEVAQMYPITNAGTDSRQYSNLAGQIRGDVTLLDRGTSPTDYLTENMSPNDKFYLNWITDSGRPNFIDTLGQATKITNISWSNTIIPGTKTNGLSTFDALDEVNLPEACGAIQKLQITSKVQNEQGVVMLAICEQETASMYIGETQQYGSAQQTTLTLSTDVIGSINVLKGSYGTINPESVVEFIGKVFWYDALNGKIIQYSENGLFPISNYKMTRFWKQFSDLYMSMTVEEIEALGSRPFVFSAVDPHHYELLFSIPKLSNTPPKGYLPDYPSTIYPFDIWDAQGKTIVYKLDTGLGVNPHWQGAYSFNPEGFAVLNNNLYSFLQGSLYLHNSTTSFNEFYGVQYTSKIMLIANQVPQLPKVYENFALEVNMSPIFVYFYADQPYQQSSDLVDFSFKDLEGILYCTILRNKLIPTASGFDTTGLLTGEKLRTVALKTLIEFSPTTEATELKFIIFGYNASKGHRV